MARIAEETVTLAIRMTPELRDRIREAEERLVIGRNLLVRKSVEAFLDYLDAGPIIVQQDGSGVTHVVSRKKGRYEA